MTLTTLILLNAVLGFLLIYALVHLLTHGVHSDRHHAASRHAEIRSLPAEQRDRIAA